MDKTEVKRSPVADYKDLRVWQQAIQAVKVVYRATERFPKTEIFGLTNQIRRSIVSVPSNIAEGQQRNNPKEFAHFLYIALGSLAEADTQMVLAHELGYVSEEVLEETQGHFDEIKRMLYRLVGSLPKSSDALPGRQHV